ncbi:ANTAR domain-containing protein [Paracoccus sp. YIM 132242]|uniref:ANTAR domain-containing protein n=1 Tax=Paracoccus lichenicola TaxID=2665644 RepID=A0A6L6HTL6_9RHOB|nr:ANTAR domain-containing protein [Paracoccus lichenicola]MTE01455.1 ANTAR domain-containing protein [Paracoccus lichenicola]
MKQPRVTQNFRDFRATVVTSDSRTVTTLQTVLPRLGLVVDAIRQTLPVEPAPGPRVVFIDGDMALPPVGEEPGMPPGCAIVGLVGSEAPSRLRGLVSLGAQAFLTKPVHSGSVYSALFLAVNSFNRSMATQDRIEDLMQRRKGRAHVLHAVTAMVLREGIDPDQAYDRLRRNAMHARQSVEDFCEALRAPKCNEDEEASPTEERRRRA